MILKNISLVVLLPAFLVSGFHCFDDSKIDGILKKVGRRFSSGALYARRNWRLQFRIDRAHRLKEWDAFDEVTRDEIIRKYAEEITGHIFLQSSIENPRWQEHVKWLYDMQDDDMLAEICGTPVKLNKYQFDKYLHNHRQNFVASYLPRDFKFEPIKDLREFNIMIGFENQAREGYLVQNYWNFTLKLIDLPNKTLRGLITQDEREAEFKITHISINGGCTEYGHVDLSAIPDKKNDTLELLKKEKNPNVKSLFELFVPEYITYLESSTYESIPTGWLESLDDDPTHLQATVCHDEKEPRQQNYTKDEFIRWYVKFREMWHMKKDGAKDWIRVQMIDAKDDMLVARITMSVQVGTNETAPGLHDWDFRVVLRYNQHGDEKWYITALDVLCPPTIDNYRDLSLMHIGDVVTANFLSYSQRLPKPVKWYQTLDFLKPFTHENTILADICNQTTTLTEIYSKVINREYENMETPKGEDIPKDEPSYIMYNVDNESLDLPAEELENFKLFTSLNARAKRPFEWIYVWDFKIRWDDKDRFYYVEKVELACPEKINGPELYRFRKIEPDRFYH
ncbi:hypothetical protein B9Z55_007676 [Caenorhabditis nigoni]|uniref:NTF2-like domain-containing protein n=1 Tax=Caenorhabditis nigoni TaxID=1611254 RepID=A0A2G5VAQ8_9PELO|nr:hypothetical protein B9Z55_007676 [Caenorhabditis nigoni]